MKLYETNGGYRIIKAEITMECDERTERIVIGEMMTSSGAKYATWESIIYEDGEVNYYFGNYFNDYNEALHDYYKRLMEKFE